MNSTNVQMFRAQIVYLVGRIDRAIFSVVGVFAVLAWKQMFEHRCVHAVYVLLWQFFVMLDAANERVFASVVAICVLQNRGSQKQVRSVRLLVVHEVAEF